MIIGGGKETDSGTRVPAFAVRSVMLVIGLGTALAVGPVGLGMTGGDSALSIAIAFADEGKGGDKNADKGDHEDGDKDSDKDGDKDSDEDSDRTDGAERDADGGSRASANSRPEARDSTRADRDERRLNVGRGVSLAQFTTQISRRLPGNQVSVLSDPNQAVSFFTELVDMQGRTVTHRWRYGGVVVYEASSTINGFKWRFWSTQILPADKAGIWSVEVVDESDRILQSQRLEYRPAG